MILFIFCVYFARLKESLFLVNNARMTTSEESRKASSVSAFARTEIKPFSGSSNTTSQSVVPEDVFGQESLFEPAMHLIFPQTQAGFDQEGIIKFMKIPGCANFLCVLQNQNMACTAYDHAGADYKCTTACTGNAVATYIRLASDMLLVNKRNRATPQSTSSYKHVEAPRTQWTSRRTPQSFHRIKQSPYLTGTAPRSNRD